MGSLFIAPKVPTPPAPPPPSTSVNQVRGVEQVPVLNAGGGLTYVKRPIAHKATKPKNRKPA